jgi:uncharacterized repeat protein (TIGR02543 family)
MYHNVSFSGAENIPQQQIEYGYTATRPENPTREGYTFGGWFTEETCEHEWNFETNTVTAHTTLYAQWKPNEEVGVKTTSAQAIPVAYYNLLGQKLREEPTSGMYIVRYSNGTSERKVR